MLAYTLLLFVINGLVKSIYGFTTGYDPSMCTSLTPDFGSPEMSASPFNLTVRVTKYNQGGYVDVEITSAMGHSVVGFILQARTVSSGSNAPVGTWAPGPSQTKTIQCSAADDTKTHSSTIPKGSSPKFRWLAPADCSEGSMKFHATIATGKYDFWIGIVSDELDCSTDPQTPAPPAPTSAQPTDQPSEQATESNTNSPTVSQTDRNTESHPGSTSSTSDSESPAGTSASAPVTPGGTDGSSPEVTDGTTDGVTDSRQSTDSGNVETASSSSSTLVFSTTVLLTFYGLSKLMGMT